MPQNSGLKRVNVDDFIKGLEINLNTLMKISGVNASYAVILAKFIKEKNLYEEFLNYCEKNHIEHKKEMKGNNSDLDLSKL